MVGTDPATSQLGKEFVLAIEQFAPHGVRQTSKDDVAAVVRVTVCLRFATQDDVFRRTMKLKRRSIAAKYAAEIDELYASERGPEEHEPTTAQTVQPA